MQSQKPKAKGRKPAVRTRQEREAELQLLAAMGEGKWVLADIAKRYLSIPAGEGVTPHKALHRADLGPRIPARRGK